MRAAVLPNYIELDDEGRAWVTDTNTRVLQIVMNKIAWGWEADRIHEEYPHLPLAKIHAAFQYYYDHKEQCDREIEKTSRWIEEMRRKQPESPLRKRLRDRGILP
jgi:uncharacterized protein (DUF433 family)